ncbi:hypothetical protein ACN28S_47150 [Cystobacter fuscus]
MHISNLHLNLLPIAVAHAWVTGLHATLVTTGTKGDARDSSWMLLSADAHFSRGDTFPREGKRVKRLAYDRPPPTRWTDERSSVLPVLRVLGGSGEGILEEPAVPSAPVAAPASP